MFIGYERIVERQDMYMDLGLLQYLHGSGVLLSCLLITQLSPHLPNPQIRSTILRSCMAQLRSQLESLRTTILSILSQNFFMLCKKLAPKILAGVDVARIWDPGIFSPYCKEECLLKLFSMDLNFSY